MLMALCLLLEPENVGEGIQSRGGGPASPRSSSIDLNGNFEESPQMSSRQNPSEEKTRTNLENVNCVPNVGSETSQENTIRATNYNTGVSGTGRTSCKKTSSWLLPQCLEEKRKLADSYRYHPQSSTTSDSRLLPQNLAAKHGHEEGYHYHANVFHSSPATSHFVLDGVLGRGISSVVRRCIEKATGKEYAVKIIDISGEKGEEYQAEETKRDTIREINVLRMCAQQPHIIELHDVFETPTFIFLVFELCKQGELFDYLTQVVTLSEKRTRIIMRQLFEAVEFIHSRNVVHRDLKPENILLDDNLNVKLSDFGFAVILDEGEELMELCGTPGYLAPEVLAVSMYDDAPGYRQEVDMWACGVIMYTLLCGAPPFWHRKQMQMLRMIMQANYTFGSPEWDDISQAPKDLIANLLLIDPKKRLTAKEVLNHPFFHREITPTKKFFAKRTFKAAVLCVTFFHRLQLFYHNPPAISIDTVRTNPYGIKQFRKLIDGCAFGMYGHWVKKADNQNRAALFEHTLRDEWKETIAY